MNVTILEQDILVTIVDDDTIVVTIEQNNFIGQSAIQFDDEGTALGTVGTVTEVDFAGAGVTGSRTGSKVTYTIPGSSGGSGTPGGSTTQIQFNNAGAFGGFGSWNGTTFAIGTLGYSDTGINASFQSSTNSFNQVILQNTNAGAAASTNFNVSNDAGTATTNFGEFGINSSGFTGTGSFSQAGYVYLAAATTDLVIGTYGNKSIRFVVNSGATDAITISGAGAFTFNGSTTAIWKGIFPSLGTTPVEGAGLWLANTTAAAVGAQQVSPSTTWEGQGWATGVNNSQSVKYMADVLPVQAATNPTATWRLRSSINGAAYVDQFTVGGTTGLFGWDGTRFYAGPGGTTSTAAVLTYSGAFPGLEIYASGARQSYILFNSLNTTFSGAAGVSITIAPNKGTIITQGNLSSAWIPTLQITPGAHTSLTAATAFPNHVFSSATQTWVSVAGTIAAQKDTEFRAITHSAATSGTITDLYNVYFEDPLVSVNMTATRKWSIGAQGSLNVEKNIVIGTAALATNATDGFFHLSSSAGAPSGTPTAYTGRVPIHVDTTNNFLYLYIGGAWKKSTVYA